MSQDGVHVQIGMGNQGGKKVPETLAEVQAAPAAAAACSNNACSASAWSSKCMWGAFLLGWIFPPAWWAGVAGGLRCGKDNECFLKRRDGTCTLAWAANVLMSLVSAVVLILVLSIVFGRPGPQQDGEHGNHVTLPAAGRQMHLVISMCCSTAMQRLHCIDRTVTRAFPALCYT